MMFEGSTKGISTVDKIEQSYKTYYTGHGSVTIKLNRTFKQEIEMQNRLSYFRRTVGNEARRKLLRLLN